MSLIATDWSVTRSNGNIRYIGDDHGGAAPSYATVIELHRWLQGLADDAVSGADDEISIVDVNPSARSTDNIIRLLGIYNIDDNAAEHLFDGSIIQGTGGTEVIYDGIVNFGNPTVQIQIIQNGAVLADDWWNFGGGGLNADAAQGISHRFMMKIRNAGADIDGRRLIGTTRQFNKTYGEFSINGTSRGNNVLALSNSDDLNNQTAIGTVAGWNTISNTTQGYKLLDVDDNAVNESYYSEWNKATFTINQLYERAKWLTRDGSSSTLYGLNGELFRGITHEITLSGASSGTFNAFEPVSWSGGTGQMLAINNQTAGSATKMWIQLLTGVAPTNAQLITGVTSTATATASGSALERPVSKPFIGQSTGSAIIGAYGIGVETADLAATDKLFDLTNTPVTPPNNVTFTVGGVVSAEDRILVAPWDGSTLDPQGNPAIDTNQLSLNVTLNTNNITSVVVSTPIPSDTPSSGYIRVEDNSGKFRRLHYSSWTGSTFTVDTVDGNEDFGTVNATAGNDVYIAYIDELASASSASFTAVYSSNRNLVVIVRDGGGTPIKEFITSAVFGAANTTVTAIRTSDV